MKFTIRLCSVILVLIFVCCGKKVDAPRVEKAPHDKKEIQATTTKTWRDFVMAIKDLKLELKLIIYHRYPNAAELNISAVHTYINAVKAVHFEGCDEELATFLSTYPGKMESVVRDGLFAEGRGDNVKKQAAVKQFNMINIRIRELAKTLSTRYGEPFDDPWSKQ